MKNTNGALIAVKLCEKADNYPVGTVKRRRIVRRILRVYAAWFRTVRNDPKTAQAYERAARKF